jgi:hypothetical protein
MPGNCGRRTFLRLESSCSRLSTKDDQYKVVVVSKDFVTNTTLELRNITSTKATFLWFGNILTFSFGFDAEATTRQDTITFGLALPAQIAAASARDED